MAPSSHIAPFGYSLVYPQGTRGVCGRTCAVTKVQEFFYGCGAETVDGTHLTVKLFHQVKGAFFIRVDQHTVKHQLLFRREPREQALQAGDVVYGQLQGLRLVPVLFPEVRQL